VGGGGEGDLVPGLEVKRRFSSLLSHAHRFMEDSERRDNIEFLYTQVLSQILVFVRFPTIELWGVGYEQATSICEVQALLNKVVFSHNVNKLAVFPI
jgi:hypothetical protein